MRDNAFSDRSLASASFFFRRRVFFFASRGGSSGAVFFFLADMAYAAAIRTAALWRSVPNTALSSMRTFDLFVVPESASKRAKLTGDV